MTGGILGKNEPHVNSLAMLTLACSLLVYRRHPPTPRGLGGPLSQDRLLETSGLLSDGGWVRV